MQTIYVGRSKGLVGSSVKAKIEGYVFGFLIGTIVTWMIVGVCWVK